MSIKKDASPAQSRPALEQFEEIRGLYSSYGTQILLQFLCGLSFKKFIKNYIISEDHLKNERSTPESEGEREERFFWMVFVPAVNAVANSILVADAIHRG